MAALDMYMEKGQWEKCIDTAEQQVVNRVTGQVSPTCGMSVSCGFAAVVITGHSKCPAIVTTRP